MSSPYPHQDWETVVLKKKPEHKPPKGGGGGRGPIIPEDGTEMKRKVIPVALKTAIMKARVAKKWKQQDLATKLGVPLKTVMNMNRVKQIQVTLLFVRWSYFRCYSSESL